MKSLFILFLFSVSPFALAIDVGDGSDGACTAATLNADLKRSYQCTSLILNAPVNLKGTGGNALVIKVQGVVQITSTIELSGADGLSGDSSSGKLGGKSGPGGGNGGGSQLPPYDGIDGSGFSPGLKGIHVDQFGGAGDAYGGGGGGGTFVAPVSAVEPDDGFNSGPLITSKGSNGASTLADASYFNSTFVGGSGGAGGGGGYDSSVPSVVAGSSGAGGGGALRIISGGDVSVTGTINANGGNGGGIVLVTPFSGAGGGGAGGAIWIQAAGSLTVSGTLRVKGGIGGGNDFNLKGGNGSNGGIRLDSGGALDTTGATFDPGGAPYHTSFTPTPLEVPPRQYSSSISCAKVSLENQEKNFVINLIGGFIIAAAIHFVSSKRKV